MCGVGESVYVVCSECDKAGGGKSGEKETLARTCERVGHNNKCGPLVCDRWLPGCAARRQARVISQTIAKTGEFKKQTERLRPPYGPILSL